MATIIIVAAAFLLFSRGFDRQRLYTWIALIVGIAVVWFIIRPRAGVLLSAAEVQNEIGAGQSVLLEFQSQYCMACIAIKPTVDAIEEELRDEIKVIRIDIQSQTGKTMAPDYGFIATPTFILFDEGGNEIYRSIVQLDVELIRALVASP